MDNKTYSVNITTNTLLNLIWIGVIVLLLIQVKSLLLVVLTSVVIASFIGSSATSIKRRLGIGRTLSVAMMYVFTVLVFSAIFYFFIPILIKEIANVLPLIVDLLPPQYLSNINIEGIGNASNIASEITANNSINNIFENFSFLFNNVSSGFFSTISTFFGGVANVVLVAVISFYLSISKDGISNFLRIITPVQHEAYVIDLWSRSQRKIARWMQGQLLLGVVVGLLTFIGLTVLQVEYALLLAVVAGVFELIPFGIFLAVIPAVSLSFASGGLTVALMVVALYLVIQQLEGYLIAPMVVHKMTGVSPLVVILSVLVGIQVAGLWGLILAVPVAVTILEYVGDIEKKKLKLQNSENV